jgi:hypothetical protein
MTVYSQKIVWEELPFNKVDEINYDNDSLVNMTQFPFDYNENNGLIYRVASTEFYEFQKEDWVKEIVSEYLEKNQIKDNGKQENKYAITLGNGIYKLKKHKTEKRYYYGEGSGVLDYTVINENPGYLEKEIFCIINDSFPYPETKFYLQSISPTKDDGVIKPNQSCHFKVENTDYILEYTADFCNGQFEVGGFGTIYPTYYNLLLKIKDVANNKTQNIWQIPHEHLYKLRDIEIGDINNDKKQDIVLTIIDELCIKRILYLSNDSSSDKLFRSVGTMMIYCDYP